MKTHLCALASVQKKYDKRAAKLEAKGRARLAKKIRKEKE